MPGDSVPTQPLPFHGEDAIERDLGEQPIAQLMLEHGLKAHDLVAASTEQITHKMVARACKGRRLTRNTQGKVLRAFNLATGKRFSLDDLFNYQALSNETPGPLRPSEGETDRGND